jgi:branched-chain amino acid transport system substrate-binding protein
VLGDLVLSDGNANVAILALQDSYGEGLAENAELSITEGGGAVATTVFYDPKAANYAAEVTEVISTNPDAVILIGFDETKKIIPEMIKQGAGPADLPIYFVDGNLADYSADFEEGTLAGVKGTLPGAEVTDEFKQLLIDAYGDLTVFSYGPESYDASCGVALAAEAAGSDSGEAIASQLQAVSAEGEKCTTFADCVELIKAGTDIDYDGVSGPIEFDENGDPTEAFIGIYEYDDTNTPSPLEFRAGSL